MAMIIFLTCWLNICSADRDRFALLARTKSPAADRHGALAGAVADLSLEPHIILDGLDTRDAAGNLDRIVDVRLRTDEATQLHHTLEGFDVDFRGFQCRFVEHGRLDLRCDD